MIMRIGKTREGIMTNRQIEVKFTIMKDEDNEKYLGDIVGNKVSEEKRFDKRLGKMKEKGNKWNKEKLTVYGRALVSNTIMMPIILYITSKWDYRKNGEAN